MQTHTLSRIKSISTVATLAVLLSGCGTPGRTASPPEIGVELNGSEFKLPAEIPGGIVALTLKNSSAKKMDFNLMRIRPGNTVEQVVTALKTANDDPTDALKRASLVLTKGVEPGKSERAIVDLKSGDMLFNASETVEGPPPPNAPQINSAFKTGAVNGAAEPKADVTVDLSDFVFVLPEQVKAGKQVWRIANTGKQWHMMLIVKPNDGVKTEDILKMMESSGPPSGPPPFEGIAEVPPISESERQWIELDLKPGTYLVLCPLPDLAGANGGPPKPHTEHGMHRILIVK